jgi:hypothetical protein
LHLGGHGSDLRLQSRDSLFGPVALDIGLQDDLAADGFDRLGVSPLVDRRPDDRFQFLDGSLGKAFAHGVIDLLP